MAANSIEDRVLVISTHLINGEVQTSVQDQGVGLTDSELNCVFDRFFTKKSNGVGLGLAISKTIIESHAGRIWASGNDLGGVTFHFSLPAAQ